MINAARMGSWAAVSLLTAVMAVPASGAPQQARKAPELEGGIGWFNTQKPVTMAQLRGKIVLLDFWTYC